MEQPIALSMLRMARRAQTSSPELFEEERSAYVALSTLIDILSGHQSHKRKLLPGDDFMTYKQTVLTEAQQACDKLSKEPTNGAPFNILHYQRAILNASDSNYRHMAVMAAIKDLHATALLKLVSTLTQHCVSMTEMQLTIS